MTMEFKQEYLIALEDDPDNFPFCPFCRSETIRAFGTEYCRCYSCNRTWRDIYKVVDVIEEEYTGI